MGRVDITSAVLSPSEVRTLTEVGLMACGAGNIRGAELIFGGLQSVGPVQPSSFIGLAMARIEAGDAGQALAILEKVSGAAFSNSAEFRVFLAICLLAAGRRNEAERELRGILTLYEPDEPEWRLASALLARHVKERHVILSPHLNMERNFS